MAEQLPRLVDLQPAEGAKVQATPTRLKCLKAHCKEDGTGVFAADAREALQHIAPQDEPQAHISALKATASLHPALHMWLSRCLGIRRQLYTLPTLATAGIYLRRSSGGDLEP